MRECACLVYVSVCVIVCVWCIVSCYAVRVYQSIRESLCVLYL